jgi:hypothetical protein
MKATMTNTLRLNLGMLRSERPGLAEVVTRTAFSTPDADGLTQIRLELLPAGVHQQLLDWINGVAPAAIPLVEAEDPAERQRIFDTAAFVDRIDQYVKEQGLAQTEENIALIKAYFDKNLNGYLSAAGLDAGIANLRRSLKWNNPTQTPVSPEPTARVETPLTLPNGEPQLPLGADVRLMKKASLVQLRDLSKRRAEGQWSRDFSGR